MTAKELERRIEIGRLPTWQERRDAMDELVYLEESAYHESAHALAAIYVRGRFDLFTIDPAELNLQGAFASTGLLIGLEGDPLGSMVVGYAGLEGTRACIEMARDSWWDYGDDYFERRVLNETDARNIRASALIETRRALPHLVSGDPEWGRHMKRIMRSARQEAAALFTSKPMKNAVHLLHNALMDEGTLTYDAAHALVRRRIAAHRSWQTKVQIQRAKTVDFP